MSRFDNMIVAVDGSGDCTKTVQALLNLPFFVRPHITLLHAVSPQISADQMHLQQERGKEILAASSQALAVKPDVVVTTELVEGDPKIVVLNKAEESHADLIVMGSRNRTRLNAILENSVSQYVFQLSTCAMLLVKEGINIRPVQRIMVAIDGSPASQTALTVGIEMVRDLPDAPLYLVRIQSASVPENEDTVLTTAISQLKRLGIPYKTTVAVGDPGGEISRLAAEKHIDLLIMGSPDRRPNVARSLPDLDRLLGKSVSDYVRVHIECPVLMVRPRQD